MWGDGTGNYIAHQRLSIVSPDLGNSTVEGSSGNQPLFTKDKTLCWIVNGEIYNHTALKVTPYIFTPAISMLTPTFPRALEIILPITLWS